MASRALLLQRRLLRLARVCPRILPPALNGITSTCSPLHTGSFTLISRHIHQASMDGLQPSSSSTFPSTLVLSEEEDSSGAPAAEDEIMNEFLSRFVWKMCKEVVAAYPDIDRPTRDAMLLVIAQRVACRVDRGCGELLGISGSASALANDPGLELSPHLWVAAWEAAGAVLEDMRRARRRELMRGFLHSEKVKGMCRFAAEAGMKGPMLREMRFKWALEEMEDWEFVQGLQRMAQEARSSGEVVDARELSELPQRQGKIRYKIHGLDLSDAKWAETTDMAQEAEKKIAPEEAIPLMGKTRVLTEKILGLEENDDPKPLMAQWAEEVQPKRVDWDTLLSKIKDCSSIMYFKVAELLLDEPSFMATIRDYSKLIEAHSEAGCIEEAEKILHKMTEKGIKPDILTSIVLVHLYGKSGNLERAKEEFANLKMQGFQPDYKLYVSMIKANLKAGAVNDAELILRQMDTDEMKPSNEIYLELLRGFSEIGKADGARRIVSDMQFAGIPQTLESYTLLIEAYAKNVVQKEKASPDHVQAQSNFDFMIRSGIKPDDRCIAAIVATYEKGNHFCEALNFLLDLEKDGFKVGVSTYSVLVDWLGKMLLVNDVEDVLQKITEIGDVPYKVHVSLCDMYSRAGEEAKALKSLKILLARAELLSAGDFKRVIHGLLDGGLRDDAKRVYDIMKERGMNPDEDTNTAIMAGQALSRWKSNTNR